MLHIYKASAGSGKTHQLTSVFLRLAFEHSLKFKEILAVTFTNKAAAEMKERIVEELVALAQKGESASHYKTVSALFPEESVLQIKRRANTILKAVLHNYSDFSIGTIDSFVQKVLRSFALEMGMHSGYKIEFDTNKVANDLTRLLFDKLESDPDMQKWLVNFANFKISQGKNWDFRRDVKSFAQEIFKESFQRIELKTDSELKNKIKSLDTSLRKIKKDFAEQMSQFCNQAKETIKQYSINPKATRNIGYICNYLTNKIDQPQKKTDYEPSATILKCTDYQEAWATKTSDPAEVQAIFVALNPILSEAITLLQEKWGIYLLANNLLANFHALGVAFELSQILPSYREENNLMLISDSNQLLREIVQGNDAPFIYEKIGNHYKNILIDEFQDTSSFQWDNFRPLIENALAEGTENLIVGDVKQSIYRWRGGDWSLLLTKVKQDIGYVKESQLDTNWRSLPNIIDFNNAMFTRLLDQVLNSQLFDLGKNHDLINQLKSDVALAYEDVTQLVARKGTEYKGELKVQFFETDKRIHQKQALHEGIANHLPQEIEDLLDKGLQPRDIAILVRKNSEGKAIVDLLMQHMAKQPDKHQYALISSEALSILNSDATRVIIAALEVLTDSNDYLHWATLINFYQRNETEKKFTIFPERFAKEEKPTDWFKTQLKDALPEEFLEQFENLQRLNLFEIIGQLQRIFGLDQNSDYYPYLQAIEDLILEFTELRAGDLVTFLEWWTEISPKRSLQLSDKQNAIRVMSIHKSKGLAFKAVLLPFALWEFDDVRLRSNLWVEAKIDPFSTFPSVPLQYSKELTETPLSEEYIIEHVYRIFDALNMFYVALTRPKDLLYIYAPTAPTSDKKPELKNIADGLYSAIQQLSSENCLPNATWDSDKLYFHANGDFPQSETPSTSSDVSVTKLCISNWRDKLSLVHKSSQFFIESDSEIERKVNYGNLMHEVFSKIETTNDVEPVLTQMRWAGRIGVEELDTIKDTIREITTRKNVKNWFSGEWEVYTEKGIITINGETRIPDRVMRKPDEVLIVDFKFGEERDSYKKQIQEYARLLSDIEHGKKVTAVLYYANTDKLVSA